MGGASRCSRWPREWVQIISGCSSSSRPSTWDYAAVGANVQARITLASTQPLATVELLIHDEKTSGDNKGDNDARESPPLTR
jgi:hypothetical protein